MKKDKNPYNYISKRQINIAARIMTGVLLIPMAIFAPLLLWGLVSGGIIFGVSIALFVLAPISLEAINKLYPGKKLPRLLTVLEAAFLAWFVLNIISTYSSHGSLTVFLITIGLYGLIICMALIRIYQNIKQGDATMRVRYAASIATVLVLLCGVAILAFRADQQSRHNFSIVTNASMAIIGKVSKLDAVLQTKPVGSMSSSKEIGLGNGLLDEANNCGSDVNCPASTRSLLVQLRHGDEDRFMKQLAATLTKSKPDNCLGFGTNNESAMCYMQFYKDGYSVTISLNRADSYHHGAPSPAEGEKVWRYLVVTVYK